MEHREYDLDGLTMEELREQVLLMMLRRTKRIAEEGDVNPILENRIAENAQMMREMIDELEEDGIEFSEMTREEIELNFGGGAHTRITPAGVRIDAPDVTVTAPEDKRVSECTREELIEALIGKTDFPGLDVRKLQEREMEYEISVETPDGKVYRTRAVGHPAEGMRG